MKHLLCLILLSCLLSRVAAAQSDSLSKNPLEISISSGISYPYLPGEFKNYWKNGTVVAAGIGYSLQPGSLGYSALSLEVAYSTFQDDPTAFTNSLSPANSSLAVEGTSTKIVTALATYRGTFATSKTSIAPYFLMGVGYFNISAGTISVPSDPTLSVNGESKSTISWMVGAGLNVPVSSLGGLFVEAQSVLGATGDTERQYFPVKAGIRLTIE